MTILGIFPDCSNVKLQGDIVKVEPSPRAAADKPVAARAPAAAPAHAQR